MASDDKPKIAIFASPKCIYVPKLHKDYFNVAWFVQAYGEVLNKYDILTTRETEYAVREAFRRLTPEDHEKHKYWKVPTEANNLQPIERNSFGFDGQVRLAGAVARGEVERVLMFMDPYDTKEYLPETYAFIRNCTLAGVGLHINLGATYWAESVRQRLTEEQRATEGQNEDLFGGWRTNASREGVPDFCSLLNPMEQAVYFIAHDTEKEKLSRFVYHYRKILIERTGWKLSGTSGTSGHINKYLAARIVPFWETPSFKAAGAGPTGHGPTGGDVVIADEICKEWPVDEKEGPLMEKEKPEVEDELQVKMEEKFGVRIKGATPVRDKKLTHTVLFFIDYLHAQPHEADIHLLLRTCLNPHRGIHLILNEKTAIEWGETIREGCFSKDKESGKKPDLEGRRRVSK